jgi:methylphosphotriester-DNA--protein-cysteine methyltransferase
MSKKTKRSSGAVATAWKIFAKHPKDRAAALAAAEKAGVNPNTAKTQWQRFLHASPKQRAEKMNDNGNKEEKKPAAE